MNTVDVATDRGPMPMYVAVPAGVGRFPGVVVLHDAMGMSDDVRNQADWLATEGFVAAAPDLLHWGRKVACLRALFKDVRARRGASYDDVEAARSWLASLGACTGAVGVIGYCMGGGFALLLAPRRYGFGACSVNYGEVPKDAAAILEGACPVVGSFGVRDRTLKGAAGRLERALREAAVPHDVKEYPEAGHSFLNDHDSVLFAVAGRLMGGGYDEGAALDARRRIIGFFRTHLQA
jgi:carboxymethylenebutenolidase